MYAKFYQNISSVQERGPVSFLYFTSAKPRPNVWKMTFGKTSGWSLSIWMCMQNFTEIFQNIQEIGPVLLLSEFGPRQNLHRRQMAFDNPFVYIVSISMIMRNFMKLCYTHKYDLLCPNLCYTWKYDVFSQKWCYIRKCGMSELMLHTKMCNAQIYVIHEYEICLSEPMLHRKM